ncbi:helix-turn-helix domain-containing protein [Acinetobacter baumannii]|uniref:helix-turn-helix domain-containing protein n=1 Tax=Acinetobacter baumannii TaxID=470 RepID=UPI000707A730|nr:helix-turn-helix transcriptional regulator [Acinetobacter baumannii]KQE26087.1 DNA-binding protein [Acinetobacter baumannii]
MKSAATNTKRKLTVAQYLDAQLNASDLNQSQLAEIMGINQNMVSFIVRGKSKLPLERVRAMADALKIDAKDLFMRCLEEYIPHLLEEMEAMIEQPLITDAESNLIKQIREANAGHNFEFFNNPRQKEAFDAFLETLKAS